VHIPRGSELGQVFVQVRQFEVRCWKCASAKEITRQKVLSMKCQATKEAPSKGVLNCGFAERPVDEVLARLECAKCAKEKQRLLGRWKPSELEKLECGASCGIT